MKLLIICYETGTDSGEVKLLILINLRQHIIDNNVIC